MFYQKKNNKLEPLTGSTLYAETPIGTVIASFLAVAPSGYIKCDGTVYTKAQYPELYERIPDVFKDTTNETFTIDLREVALKGIGLSSLTTEHYSSTGLTLGEFIEDRLQSHQHSFIGQGSNPTAVPNVGASYTGDYVFTAGQSSGRRGNTTEVKAVGVNYFIKAKQIGVPADIMDAISEEYATKEYVDDLLEPRVIDLSNKVSSSFTLTDDGACAIISGKNVQIIAHAYIKIALGQQAAQILTNLELPTPANQDFISGACYLRDSSSSTAYKSAFCAYNPANGSLIFYNPGSISANSLIEASVTYISE